ncbi:uncharacterized protein BO97DRAFT_421454 [Aspergillus homomorphus CBS 101889]|uniref:Uncharacterized protein n=1 Tax=Aspergillus homomorphus (strain CBS 101889) TaxID=1450537 RepID=A0A395I7U7_ASPHC|nr:hypothetical protein BO97DRAFT_421454 [Aspergillus homomorphus CBS 101889]RAL15323.1 hypothetical protein BO97DRAFT_421454 [Aspergillus homomorphus CBS 101889]
MVMDHCLDEHARPSSQPFSSTFYVMKLEWCVFAILRPCVVARQAASEMSGIQSSSLLPLKSDEEAPYLDYNLQGRWTPDIEKNQCDYELPDDRDDAFSSLSALFGYRRNSLLGFASYVIFSIISFISAAYYFWSLIPYEPSQHSPVSIVAIT